MLTLVLTRHGLTPRSDPEQHLGQRIDIELSPAGQAQAVALATDDGHRARVIDEARRYVDARHDAAVVARAYEAVYDELL